MANRSMAAKRLKIVKMRRALGKYIPPARSIEEKDDYEDAKGVVTIREYNDDYRSVLTIPKRNYVTLADNAHHRVRIYYGNKIFITREDRKTGEVHTSRHYKTISQAKFVYSADLVGWIDTQVSPP